VRQSRTSSPVTLLVLNLRAYYYHVDQSKERTEYMWVTARECSCSRHVWQQWFTIQNLCNYAAQLPNVMRMRTLLCLRAPLSWHVPWHPLSTFKYRTCSRVCSTILKSKRLLQKQCARILSGSCNPAATNSAFGTVILYCFTHSKIKKSNARNAPVEVW
jgi:hypothetical protein